jgi:ankyrin repeat protein
VDLDDTFLHSACWDHHIHGKADHRMYDRAAQRILEQHPAIARHSLFTAIVCGEIDEVARIVAERPQAARESGGPRGWTPILYLAFTRFTHPKTIANAMGIARLLLDRGANPNDFYMAGDSHYTALTGVAGEGEQDAPRQPYAAELFDLLLERGAEPFDQQVLYDTHFSGDVLWWLDLVYEHTRDSALWRNPTWPMLDMGPYGSGARFLLELAVKKRDVPLAEWVLRHGATPNAAPASDRRFPKRSLYEEALLAGLPEMAELFARYGAAVTQPVLNDRERLVQALMRGDREDVRALIDGHRDSELMFEAARRDRPDVIALLLDLGMSVDVADSHNTRALHHAAAANALEAATFLIEHGAEVDPRESHYDGTPIGWASHGDAIAMIDFLSQYSRNIWTLCWRGYIDRVAEILRETPELARQVDNEGVTPLWWLPDDETKALQIVELLLAAGADPSRRSRSGKTAADWASTRGMSNVAARLAVGGGTPAARGYNIDAKEKKLRPLRALSPEEWDGAIAEIAERGLESIEADGRVTDAVLERIASLPTVTALNLEGCRNITDDGLRHLARMPQLRSLNLTGCSITDAGASNLEGCPLLERVSLMGTSTGDGAIAALAGKTRLRFFQGGDLVTDSGLARFHEFPRFKTWQGGEIEYSLLSPHAGPTFLWLNLKAPFTDAGLARLAGLDGLFALSLFSFGDSGRVTPAGLASLTGISNLGWLGCTGELCDDDAMQRIAALPRLRMLMCQDTQATDAGFAALSRSSSIEHIWGRRGHKLTRPGFEALSRMPALRGLAVSCMNLDDEALSALPRFPALRELVPIQVPDEGFRHVGRCEQLEALWCMYCGDTGDVATELIAGLRQLRTYYAGRTRITDRSLEILGGIDALERVELWHCPRVTDAGLPFLAKLPRLREVALQNLPGVTLDGASVFPSTVHVDYAP